MPPLPGRTGSGGNILESKNNQGCTSQCGVLPQKERSI